MNPLTMATGPHGWRLVRWAGLLFLVSLGSALALALGGGPASSDPGLRPVGVTVAADVLSDRRDTGSSPLDMLDATLVQRDVRMVLKVSFGSGSWKAADLAAQPGRGVCLVLAAAPPRPRRDASA